MLNFDYKVSVIVPVYNAEIYLRGCLDSLCMQTLDSEQIEILLIDDGSTDKSGEICKEYVKICEMFKYFFQENAGPSAARNKGISAAKGKYIMFLDADDTLSANTIELVVDFFDKNYEIVDLVSYYDQYYQNGKKLPPHARYKYLTKSGIYDLNKVPYCMQMRLSICTKNLFYDNKYFDESMIYQEDQKYCTSILKNKMKLGFVKEAVYKYNKNETSIVGTSTNPIVMFEKTTSMFEEMFEENEIVPKYYQSLFFHDLQWKFSSSCLYPYHYTTEDLKKAKERIHRLLCKVDNEIIMGSNELDNYQKLYWIREKKDNKLTPVLTNNKLQMFYNGNLLYSRKDIEIILKRIRIDKRGVAKIVGYFKSPFFSVCDNCDFFVETNGDMKKLDVLSASNSYYHAKEKTDNFWSFSYLINIEKIKEVRFWVSIEGMMYKTVFWVDKKIPFSKSSNRQEYAVNNCKIKLIKNSIISFEKITEKKCIEIIDEYTINLKDIILKKYREYYIKNKDKHIWLYTDNYAVDYDNGWLQYIDDIKRDDNIERYYILTNSDIENSFDMSLYSNIVPFGSNLHKMLLLCAEKLLTAFIEEEVCFPFSSTEISYLNDLLNVEVIYLQHGVLHAHLPWYYSPTNVTVDKEVVSTQFEIDNLSSNYGFKIKDLIPVGMPRYNHINKNSKPDNKILFAPSWRSYLIGEIKSGSEIREGNKSKLFSSNYYKNIMKFIKSYELSEILERFDLELHLKFHPEFMKTYGASVSLELPRVKFINTKVDISHYKLFITDFSSFVFDYAYLNRPIMYYIPDYEEFCAGMNRYRELDLPLEDAFGPFAKNWEEAIIILEKICKDNFKPEKKYDNRMKTFFLPMANVTDCLYNYLISSGV